MEVAEYDDDVVEVEEEAYDPSDTQEGNKRLRTQNYCTEKDIALGHAWLNVSLDASVDKNQTYGVELRSAIPTRCSSHQSTLKA